MLVLESFLDLETHIEIGIMPPRILLIFRVSIILDNRLGWTGPVGIGIVDRLGGDQMYTKK